MSAKTKTQSARCIPLPNESIKEWVNRYKALFSKEPDSAYMKKTEWPCISLVSQAQVNFSRTLQSALATLKEMDPAGETYFWTGRAQIWFTSDTDAVMLKLKMNH